MGRPAHTTTRVRLLGLLAGMALAAMMVSGALGSPAAAHHDFPDVPTNSPFHDEIGWLAHGGYAHGYHDGTFRPDAPVSRQAFVAILQRLDTAANGGGHHGHDAGRMDPHVHPFPDVAMDNPFHDAIMWAAQEGLVEGYPDGTFRPTAPVSRQAAVAVLHRLSGLGQDYRVVDFVDVPAGHRFHTAIGWADMTNLAEGYQAGAHARDHDVAPTTTSGSPTTTWAPPPMPTGPTFEPTRAVSRQAIAALLHRFDAMMGHHWPAAAHHHHECTAPVTPDQQAAADQLLADVQASLARWTTTQDVVDAGYRYLAPPFGGAGAHYINDEYMADGLVLDPMKPESLMVKGGVVEGAMFLMEEVGEAGPMVGGCLTVWHAHDNLCYSAPPDQGGTVGWLVDMGGCPSGSMLYLTPEMLHVYIDGRPNPFEGLET